MEGKSMVLTKYEEKRMINDLLNGQGYFADEFSVEDVEKMLQNIDQDMPILCGTRYEEDLREAKARVMELERVNAALRMEVADMEDKKLQAEVREVELKRECEALLSKVNALEYDWGEEKKIRKRLEADHKDLMADYTYKAALVDTAVEALGRLSKLVAHEG